MLGKKEVEWVDVRGQWVEGHATVREGRNGQALASRVQCQEAKKNHYYESRQAKWREGGPRAGWMMGAVLLQRGKGTSEGGGCDRKAPPGTWLTGPGGGAEPKASGETVASEGLQCAARGALALDGVLGGHGDGRQELGDLAQVGGVSKEGVGKELRGGGPLFGLLPEA